MSIVPIVKGGADRTMRLINSQTLKTPNRHTGKETRSVTPIVVSYSFLHTLPPLLALLLLANSGSHTPANKSSHSSSSALSKSTSSSPSPPSSTTSSNPSPTVKVERLLSTTPDMASSFSQFTPLTTLFVSRINLPTLYR